MLLEENIFTAVFFFPLISCSKLMYIHRLAFCKTNIILTIKNRSVDFWDDPLWPTLY